MINYLNLPNEMKNFLKEFDYIDLTKNIFDHGWKFMPMDSVLTNEGKQWFVDKKIVLRKNAIIFKIPKNVTGPIHVDSTQPEENDCAFNFVLSGHGKMQWITNLEATEITFKYNSGYYKLYENIVKFEILDVWEGNIGLVRINVPHRVVTTDSDRYCISIRLEKGSSPNTFNELSKLFGV